jgi:hypothetical protein
LNLNVLTSFIALILAVSIAAERMVEVVKGWFPSLWLFKANADPVQEARRSAWIQCLAGMCGVIIAAAAKIDVFADIQVRSGWNPQSHVALYRAASWSITGILASGGSAFWNHTLDLIKAAKVQQEKKADI